MQPRKYRVRLIPARDEGLCIATSPFDTLHKEEVEATSVPELIGKVETIAKTVGKSCQAYVDVADGGRKPRGFDAATDRLYYNLDVKPQENGDEQPPVTLAQYAASL